MRTREKIIIALWVTICMMGLILFFIWLIMKTRISRPIVMFIWLFLYTYVRIDKILDQWQNKHEK